MTAVDSNVLVYAHRSESRFHPAARRELARLRRIPGELALPVFCVSEFLRTVTNPRGPFRSPSTLEQAFDFVDWLKAAPGCAILLPGPSFPGRFRNVATKAGVTGNLIFDAQIAALCLEHGVSRILTQDADFLRFPPLQVVHLPTTKSPGA